MTVGDGAGLTEIEITDIAHGGEGVGRVNGKAHFVPGVIPGETVTARVTKDGGNWARAELVEIRQPSPERLTPPCPHAAECGGCQWQHATYEAQLTWKANTIASQLQHVGKIPDPPMRAMVAPGPPFGYRNRMEFKVFDGRPAMHRPRSHELVPLSVCQLLDGRLAEVFACLDDLEGVAGLTLRIGANTGEMLVIVDGELPATAVDWGAPLAVVDGKAVKGVAGPAAIHEQVADTRFRISGRVFFQNNTAGATALVDLVRRGLAPTGTETLLDAYAGVGLFGASLADAVDRVVAVEANRAAAEDLRVNLAASEVDHRVIRGKMARAAARLDEYAELVVADPPRTGLGEIGVDAVTATGPRRRAYVACDPASLARDAGLLGAAGYELLEVTPVDMFPQTYHVEAVAIFAPAGSAG